MARAVVAGRVMRLKGSRFDAVSLRVERALRHAEKCRSEGKGSVRPADAGHVAKYLNSMAAAQVIAKSNEVVAEGVRRWYGRR